MSAEVLEGRAAVQWAEGERWTVEPITVDAPRRGEVRLRMESAGLCHSDLSMVEGGYPGWSRPLVGGHEGVGVVVDVGPDVESLAPGDRVLLAIPVPPCGDCPACLRGLTYLCERSGGMSAGRQILDGTARHHARGQDLATFVFLGAFAELTVVHQASCLKVPEGLDPVGVTSISCAGVTGWGSVQNTARVTAGETVVVVGVGGVGANAVAAGRHLGAGLLVGVDPMPVRRDLAQRLGADVVAASLDAAREVVHATTHGRMADVVVMCLGVGDGRLLGDALAVVGKRGRVVVVNVHPDSEATVSMSLRDLQIYEKQVLGCMSGSWHGRRGARFLMELATQGRYDTSLIVDRTYPLDQLEQGFADQAAGTTVRAVLDLRQAEWPAPRSTTGSTRSTHSTHSTH